MTERAQKALEWAKEHLGFAEICGGIYNSRNTAGDGMQNIYAEDGVQIDFCYEYSYIEVFGLSTEEFRWFANMLADHIGEPEQQRCDIEPGEAQYIAMREQAASLLGVHGIEGDTVIYTLFPELKQQQS